MSTNNMCFHREMKKNHINTFLTEKKIWSCGLHIRRVRARLPDVPAGPECTAPVRRLLRSVIVAI